MLHLEVRAQQDYAFAPLSRRFPAAVLHNWCNYETDVLEIHHPDPEAWPALAAEVEELSSEGFECLRAAGGDATTRRYLLRCGHDSRRALTRVMDRHGCLVLHPITYRNGWKHYRTIVMDESRVEGLFEDLRRLATVEVVSKRPAPRPLFRDAYYLAAADLLSGLTDRQAAALLAAIEHGYYRVPRGTDYGDVARRMGVPRTTFEEHVRKGEAKVLNALAPHLAAFLGRHPSLGRAAATPSNGRSGGKVPARLRGEKMRRAQVP